MKTYAKFAIFFALGAFAIRLMAFMLQINPLELQRYGVMMHILFLLVTIFFGLKTADVSAVKTEKDLLILDFKSGFKSGGLYTVITTFLTYVYYKFIDIGYFSMKQSQLINARVELGEDLATTTANIEGFFSLQNYCVITLIGFITATGIFTVLLTVINRFVLIRFK